MLVQQHILCFLPVAKILQNAVMHYTMNVDSETETLMKQDEERNNQNHSYRKESGVSIIIHVHSSMFMPTCRCSIVSQNTAIEG